MRVTERPKGSYIYIYTLKNKEDRRQSNQTQVAHGLIRISALRQRMQNIRYLPKSFAGLSLTISIQEGYHQVGIKL